MDTELKNELISTTNSPMCDRDRNVEFLESSVLENSAFIRDMFAILLLGISTGLFFRALITPRRAVPIANQNRENPAQENPMPHAQQNQGQENRATFFQPVAGSANDFNSKTDDGPNNKKTR